MFRSLWLLAGTWAALQATPAHAAACGDAVGREALANVADGIVAADNRSDLAAVLRFYAPEAVLLPPGGDAITGTAAIRPRYETLFAEAVPVLANHVDEACVEGVFGFVRGRTSGRFVAKRGGRDRPVSDAYLMLLRRDGDGAWRITHLMWHQNTGP